MAKARMQVLVRGKGGKAVRDRREETKLETVTNDYREALDRVLPSSQALHRALREFAVQSARAAGTRLPVQCLITLAVCWAEEFRTSAEAEYLRLFSHQAVTARARAKKIARRLARQAQLRRAKIARRAKKITRKALR